MYGINKLYDKRFYNFVYVVSKTPKTKNPKSGIKMLRL